MNQITVRGFDDELSASLRRLAKREGISLNQAALRLLRKGAGLGEGSGQAVCREPTPSAGPWRTANTVGDSFDQLIGSWTQADADEMDAALEAFETIDEAAWR